MSRASCSASDYVVQQSNDLEQQEHVEGSNESTVLIHVGDAKSSKLPDMLLPDASSHCNFC